MPAVEQDEIYTLFEQIRPHIVEKGELHGSQVPAVVQS